MSHDEALEKVRKLLRLAESPNVHEAVLAAGRAQEIMERFKIESLSVESKDSQLPEEPIRDFDIDPLDANYATWKSRLAVALARENQCKVYSGQHAYGKRNVSLIGRATDVSTVRYLYAYLIREINRLSDRDCAGCGRTYYNNFRLGAVQEISDRLQQQRKATREKMRVEASLNADNSRALIVLDSALAKLDKRRDDVELWTKTHLSLRCGSGSRITFNGSARDAGRRAGREINLNRGKGITAGAGACDGSNRARLQR
jgi:hypothetical protein